MGFHLKKSGGRIYLTELFPKSLVSWLFLDLDIYLFSFFWDIWHCDMDEYETICGIL